MTISTCTMLRLLAFGLLCVHYSRAKLIWPESYQFKAVLKVPSSNITIPYEAWVDGESGNYRMDFYNGLTKLYRKQNADNNVTFYRINPESTDFYRNKLVCRELDNDAFSATLMSKSLLPFSGELTLERKENKDGIKTSRWSHFVTSRRYNVVFNYTVWTYPKTVIVGNQKVWFPVRYEYRILHKGRELELIQHVYAKFSAGRPDPTVVQLPISHLPCPYFLKPNDEATDMDLALELLDSDLEQSRKIEEFERFKIKHNKQYKNKDEHLKRFIVFKQNLRYIESRNRQQTSYMLAANRFADLTERELQVLLGTEISQEAIASLSDFHDEQEKDYLDTFDWRWYSAITPTKDQTIFCASCYAFATTAVVESSAYISRGCKKLEEVSEQALLDCSWADGAFGSKGCEGGRIDYSMNWIKTHGIPFTKDYGPYLAMPGYCHMNQTRRLIIPEFQQLPRNITAIKEFIRTHGPVATAIHNPASLKFYSSGIYDDSNCSSEPGKRSHAVTIVGYGHMMGKRYWIVKNSYGPQWGEGGFFKLAIDSNTCGAANFATGVIYHKIGQCFPIAQ